mmetsp:Transcript_59545/g.129249  ORF Transcript_59545/g.129249 Transcript_59545/m.129249 type:complete len:311 (-) Transcript_59545:341-1273(-)
MAERERELDCSSVTPGRVASSMVSAQPLGRGGALSCAWYQRRSGRSGRVASRVRKKSTTIAHSECFQVSRPKRPPSPTSSKAASRPRRHSSNSRLRYTRSAWKVSLAGCIAWYSRPLARATSVANSFVRLGSSPASRARQMASAMRRAAAASVVSPNSWMILMSSSRSTFFSSFHAGTPAVWSNLRSRGPSASGRKPRCASSNCGDEMPRSKNTPAGVTFRGPSTAPISLKGEWCTRKRPSSASSWRPTLMASGSMSKAWSEPFGERAPRMPRVCPPRPNVASTYTPAGSGATIVLSTSCSSAGVCVPGA